MPHNDEKISVLITRSEVLSLALQVAQRYEALHDPADKRHRDYLLNKLNIPLQSATELRGRELFPDLRLTDQSTSP
jgi:hypothetical protein